MTGYENVVAAIWSWLLMPLSGSLLHEIAPATAWHGRLMVFSWGMLTPVGIGVARYYKITRRQSWPASLDNKFWWHAHRLVQYAATLVMTAGVLLIMLTTPVISEAARVHAILGWIVVGLGWIQVLSALARGSKGGSFDSNAVAGLIEGSFGDHYHMTRRRRAFEYVHKGGGYLATLLAVASIALGLKLADAPRWMVAIIVCWWALLSAGAVRLQRQGRCIDTYQAIWGSSDAHPGNSVKPIGWGIHRRRSVTVKKQAD